MSVNDTLIQVENTQRDNDKPDPMNTITGCKICSMVAFLIVLSIWIYSNIVRHIYYGAPCLSPITFLKINLNIWVLLELYVTFSIPIIIWLLSFFYQFHTLKTYISNMFVSNNPCGVCDIIILPVVLVVISYYLTMFIVGFELLLSIEKSCSTQILPLYIASVILCMGHFCLIAICWSLCR